MDAFLETIPVYILAVLVLGAARVWLFPMLMVLSIPA